MSIRTYQPGYEIAQVGIYNEATAELPKFKPATLEDVPALFELQPRVARVASPADYEQFLFHNRYFPATSCFASRNRTDGQPTALGLLIENAAYADPYKVDSNMPCFRLGSVGAEGM